MDSKSQDIIDVPESSSMADYHNKEDQECLQNYCYYYKLSHQDIVKEVYPPNFLHCHISIGNVEVLIHPMKLPFQSPSILNCKLKVTYANKTESPHLLVQDMHRRHYKVLAMQDVPVEESPLSHVSQGSRGADGSGPSPILVVALAQGTTTLEEHSTRHPSRHPSQYPTQHPSRHPTQPPLRSLKRKSPDMENKSPKSKSDSDSKLSTCCLWWG